MLTRSITRSLLHGNRLGEIAREVDVQSLAHSEPVGDELERNDVEKALKAVHSLRDLNLLGLFGGKLAVIRIANNNRSTATSNDCFTRSAGFRGMP